MNVSYSIWVFLHLWVWVSIRVCVCVCVIPGSAMALSISSACIIPFAKSVASSLLPKLSPHTCRLSRHWWKLGVAWLYFSPFTIGQFITTWGETTPSAKVSHGVQITKPCLCKYYGLIKQAMVFLWKSAQHKDIKRDIFSLSCRQLLRKVTGLFDLCPHKKEVSARH